MGDFSDNTMKITRRESHIVSLGPFDFQQHYSWLSVCKVFSSPAAVELGSLLSLPLLHLCHSEWLLWGREQGVGPGYLPVLTCHRHYLRARSSGTEATSSEGFHIPISHILWDLLQATFCLVPNFPTQLVFWSSLKEYHPMRLYLLYHRTQFEMFSELPHEDTLRWRRISLECTHPYPCWQSPCWIWTASVVMCLEGESERLNPKTASAHPE